MASRLGVFVRRRVRGSRERVFDAFTQPNDLVRWFSPSVEIGTEVLGHELRVGGSYRLAFDLPDGVRSIVLGEFTTLDRPDRLAFTWTWEAPDPHAGIETLVTIRFEDCGDETEVLVTHDRFPTHETRDRHESGWATTFDRLVSFLVEG